MIKVKWLETAAVRQLGLVILHGNAEIRVMYIALGFATSYVTTLAQEASSEDTSSWLGW